MSSSFNGFDPDADVFDTDDEKTFQDSLQDNLIIGDHKHTIDGSICPTCDVIHELDSSVLEGFGPEETERFLSYLDSIPDAVAGTILSLNSSLLIPSEAFIAFLNFASKVHYRVNKHGPLLRALYEVADELTDERVATMWDIYELERSLIAAHSTLKSANNVRAESDERLSKEVAYAIDFICDFVRFQITLLSDAYREEAKNVSSYEPIEEIMQSGTYPEDYDERIVRLMVGTPKSEDAFTDFINPK